MRPSLIDVLRQLHLAVEQLVYAEEQASDEFRRGQQEEVRLCILPRVQEMIRERIAG